ncbi:hypothetical protein BDV19DRAFT_383127 [Aspergillus venezuelensis]
MNAVQELIIAPKEHGMFYFALQSSSIDLSAKLLSEMSSLGSSLFDLPLEEKLQYDIDTLGGLKTNGRNVGGLPGQRDGFASYTVHTPPSSVLGVDDEPFPRPAEINERWDTLHRFATTCSDGALVILRALSNNLNLPTDRTLESLHSQSGSILNTMRMLRYETNDSRGPHPFCVPRVTHTDLGSITLLFSETPGLQICPEGSGGWFYVAPRPGCAVVNLGDATSIWSNGAFQCALHLVASLPNTGMMERAPISPILRDCDGQEAQRTTLCEDWVRAKFVALRGQGSKEQGQPILTGRIA